MILNASGVLQSIMGKVSGFILECGYQYAVPYHILSAIFVIALIISAATLKNPEHASRMIERNTRIFPMIRNIILSVFMKNSPMPYTTIDIILIMKTSSERAIPVMERSFSKINRITWTQQRNIETIVENIAVNI